MPILNKPTLLGAAAAALLALPALAQPSSPMKLFEAGADIAALTAQAKANQKSPTVNSVVPIVTLMPYRVLLEYRTGLTPPTLHHGEAELVHVLEGQANLVIGGELTGMLPPRPGSTTDVGTGISGAAPHLLAKGDYIMVPPDTAHQFQDVQGEFVIMSIHLPVPAK